MQIFAVVDGGFVDIQSFDFVVFEAFLFEDGSNKEGQISMPRPDFEDIHVVAPVRAQIAHDDRMGKYVSHGFSF